MNLPNLEALAEWLEAGAPHVTFDMNWSIAADGASNNCGTVCCIAGAAVLMKESDETGTPMHLIDPNPFYTDFVMEVAHDWLGLPSNGDWLQHDLFDPELAPDNCTPAQAAQAVRRVMKGEKPWT